MDGERFDHLTRRLAESLPRRRLLRSAASLAGGLLAGRAAHVDAITCTDGRIECDDRCCDPGWECVGASFPRLCTPPCDGGATRCPANSASCCAGVCCPQNNLQKCVPPGSICCPGAGSAESCPASADWTCVTFEGTSFCLFCPSGNTRCGAANCCAPGFVCQEGPNPGDGACIPCPQGATKCGTKNCCTADETCSEDGECVDACPAGVASQRAGGRRSRKREVTAEAACESCPAGTVKCQGGCVPACRGKRSLDGSTCRCTKKRCMNGKVKCDGECVNTDFNPSHCGGCAGNGGFSCSDGICCNGECQAAGSTCCGVFVCPAGQDCCEGENLCCPSGKCCGTTCCDSGSRCTNPRTSTCCPTNRSACKTGCCPLGQVCADFDHDVCCPESNPYYCAGLRKCASNRQDCCPEGQAFCNTLCCPVGSVCASFERSVCCNADHPHYCAKRHKCAEDKDDC